MLIKSHHIVRSSLVFGNQTMYFPITVKTLSSDHVLLSVDLIPISGADNKDIKYFHS